MGNGELQGTEKEALRDALVSAFPTRNDLDELLTFGLDKPLNSISPPADAIPTATLKVIRWAEAQGKTSKLVASARARNPGNPALLRTAHALGLAPTLSAGATLESLVNASKGFMDINVWTAGLWDIEHRVCAVELAGKKKGTGFLVGADTVLTNYHVIRSVHQGVYQSKHLAFRFDYKQLRNGTQLEGVTFPSPANEWLIDYSPYSEFDEKPQPGKLPDAKELDYALLRVEGKPGETKARPDDAKTRGWFTLLDRGYEFPVRSFLLIAQHPDNMPMQIAIDEEAIVEVVDKAGNGFNGNGTRVRYRTNTLGGSSGSPCFNNHLELVALHHAGDPSYRDTIYGEYNQGVPIDRILALIADNNHLDALGV